MAEQFEKPSSLFAPPRQSSQLIETSACVYSKTPRSRPHLRPHSKSSTPLFCVLLVSPVPGSAPKPTICCSWQFVEFAAALLRSAGKTFDVVSWEHRRGTENTQCNVLTFCIVLMYCVCVHVYMYNMCTCRCVCMCALYVL